MNNLSQKKILLIICGGISAYKSLELVRLLKKQNAEVKTILTKSAKKFVTPLSVSSLSQGKVYDDLFSIENEIEITREYFNMFKNRNIIKKLRFHVVFKSLLLYESSGGNQVDDLPPFIHNTGARQ